LRSECSMSGPASEVTFVLNPPDVMASRFFIVSVLRQPNWEACERHLHKLITKLEQDGSRCSLSLQGQREISGNLVRLYTTIDAITTAAKKRIRLPKNFVFPMALEIRRFGPEAVRRFLNCENIRVLTPPFDAAHDPEDPLYALSYLSPNLEQKLDLLHAHPCLARWVRISDPKLLKELYIHALQHSRDDCIERMFDYRVATLMVATHDTLRSIIPRRNSWALALTTWEFGFKHCSRARELILAAMNNSDTGAFHRLVQASASRFRPALLVGSIFGSETAVQFQKLAQLQVTAEDLWCVSLDGNAESLLAMYRLVSNPMQLPGLWNVVRSLVREGRSLLAADLLTEIRKQTNFCEPPKRFWKGFDEQYADIQASSENIY